jgi:hypothetical protein
MIGRAKNSARPGCFSTFNSLAPVLSRAAGVASIWRLSRNHRFYAGKRWTQQGHTQRLKTGAITSGGSQIIGAPSFSPYQSPIRPFADSPFRHHGVIR